MRKNSLAIHSENILPIIKKWLYSSRDIFLRELVSNACDAIRKLRTLRECKEAADGEESLEIHVRLDKDKKTLTISDNGLGMSEEEVEKYIAQIAFSGAEEFLAKYQKETEKDPMIGHFGLGFYSSYMVASLVELDTLSYRPESTPVRWHCDGSSTYEIGEGARTQRGTDIILHLDEASAEFLEEAKIRELLTRFCSFMPDPIFFNDKSIGNQAPLWLKNPMECTENDYLSFYRQLYPMQADPLFWIHLNVDYPFRLQGILYFPKAERRFDDQKGSIKLFCNRVFVSDDCRDILPDYLMLLRGAIDSPDIPLNVSRSYLQVDHNVRQLGSHISKKVSDRLNALFKTDREKYIACWSELEPLVKLGLLQDDKFFERTKDVVIWKNSDDKWTTVQEYLDRAKEKKIFYCNEECSLAIQKAFLDRGIEILHAGSPINSAVMNAMEDKMAPVKFQRIDSALDPALVDESREKTILDADGKTASSRIADLFRSHLPKEELEIEAKSLSSDAMPGVVLLSEEARRLRDFLILTQKKPEPRLLGKQTFVVNTNNKLVQAAWRLSSHKPELAKELVHQIYDLTRLGQKELESAEIDQMIFRNQQLLERMAEQIH